MQIRSYMGEWSFCGDWMDNVCQINYGRDSSSQRFPYISFLSWEFTLYSNFCLWESGLQTVTFPQLFPSWEPGVKEHFPDRFTFPFWRVFSDFQTGHLNIVLVGRPSDSHWHTVRTPRPLAAVTFVQESPLSVNIFLVCLNLCFFFFWGQCFFDRREQG